MTIEELEELTNEELFGAEVLERLREEAIEKAVEEEEDHLACMDDEELLGEDRMEEMRQEEIEARLESYEEELAEMDGDELFGEEALEKMREDRMDVLRVEQLEMGVTQ